MFIYGLYCPVKKKVRYIGKAVNPERRLREHLSSCQLKLPYRKNNWLRKLIAEGLKPELQILEEVPEDSTWQEREKHWVSKFGRKNLLNGTDGGDGKEGYKKDFRPFNEARAFVQSLNLGSYLNGWVPYCSSSKRPDDIPSAPNKAYPDEWVSWNDWLRGEEKVEYIPFEEARTFVQRLGLGGQKEWAKWAASKKRPKNIPSHPEATYKDQGWVGYGDWLKGEAPIEFLSFKEARKFVCKLNLKSQLEWRQWSRNNRPENIPAGPDITYKKEWTDWSDWLGYRPKKGKDFLTFEEAREFARQLNLTSVQEWMDWAQSNKRPNNIPSAPNITYSTSWLSWSDWLGTNPGYCARPKKHKHFLPFEKAREKARSFHIDGYTSWRKFCKDGNLPSDIPSNPNTFYKNLGWINWADWLGKEKAP